MLTVAYLTNEFPVVVEPYVVEEVWELRQEHVQVIPTSVRRPREVAREFQAIAGETLYLQPLSLVTLARAAWLCLCHRHDVLDLVSQAMSDQVEPFHRRIRAVVHTWLGACYAALVRDRAEHIHVHHGYFAAWMAMTAARLLGISYSMTLHGSDLLLHHAFLGLKLKNCKFCLTVSEFNRRHILANYPGVVPGKIRVQRVGVPTFLGNSGSGKPVKPNSPLLLLSVGRLHAVKDHTFLLRACQRLKSQGFHFACLVAGEGPERKNLEKLIDVLGLRYQVTLLGHVPRANLENYYAVCDLVVLTSQSEGIPLTLMEAMAHGRPVLAPAITGIPELVVDGVTGFLYRPGLIEDFVAKVQAIGEARARLTAVRNRARQHVLEHFDQAKNLAEFAKIFPALVAGRAA